MPNYIQSSNKLKHDSLVAWRPGRIWLPAMGFTGVSVGAINEGGAGNFAYGAKWEGSHTGAPLSQEISTFGVNGILQDTAADEVNTYMPVPYDLDLSKRIYCRVHWSSGSVTTADTIDYKVWYKSIVFNTTAIAAIGNTGGTALDKLVAQDTVPTTTAYTWNVTAEGFIDAGKFADNVEGLLWSVELDAFAAGLTEDKFLLGLEVRYSPRRLFGPTGMAQEAKSPIYIAGKAYSN